MVKLGEEFCSEAGDLLFGRFSVRILRIVDADVAAWSEDEVVVSDVVERGCLAESGVIRVTRIPVLGPPRVVGASDALDVCFGKLPLGAGDHLAHVAGVDEEHLTVAVTVTVAVPIF